MVAKMVPMLQWALQSQLLQIQIFIANSTHIRWNDLIYIQIDQLRAYLCSYSSRRKLFILKVLSMCYIWDHSEWLHINATEYCKIYMGKNWVCCGNVEIIAVSKTYKVNQCLFCIWKPNHSTIKWCTSSNFDWKKYNSVVSGWNTWWSL
jgi:hypothetical protein